MQVYARGDLIKTWPRATRGRCTDPADYPPEKVAFFLRTPVWCRNQAEGLGEHVAELVTGLLADPTLHHLRAAQGILGLAERYGADRLDAACRRALAVGDPSYRTVKGILAVGADQAPPPSAADPADTASAVTPAHLHGPDRLFAHLGKNDDTRADASDDASDDANDDANDDGDEAVGA